MVYTEVLLVCRVWTLVRLGLVSYVISDNINSHFGTDTTGVNTTRRYLCEALSFMHRYIPIGLLEVLPPKLNDRAPAFRGRDELGERTLRCRLLYTNCYRNTPGKGGQQDMGEDIRNVPRTSTTRVDIYTQAQEQFCWR